MSGRSVRLTARSALALSGAGAGTQEIRTVPSPSTGTGWCRAASCGRVGPSEALTGSCLRVIDVGYRPAYRDVAAPQEPGLWRMAVVSSSGRAVTLCEPVPRGAGVPAVWVEARHLAPGPVDPTQLFHFDVSASRSVFPTASGWRGIRRRARPVHHGARRCSRPHWRTSVTSASTTGREPVGGKHPITCRSPEPATAGAPVTRRRSGGLHAAEDAATWRPAGQAPDLAVPGIGVRQETTTALTGGQVVGPG